MKITKTTFLAITTAFLSSAGAMAFGPSEQLVQTKLKSMTPKVRHAPTEHCVDFSGQWKGTCSVNGADQEAQMQLGQVGCQMLQADGTLIVIGGIETRTRAMKEGFSGAEIGMADWENEGSTLVGKQFGAYRMLSSGGALAIPLSWKMRLNDDALQVDMNIVGYEMHCRYARQSE